MKMGEIKKLKKKKKKKKLNGKRKGLYMWKERARD
jgi:hypothetical protein